VLFRERVDRRIVAPGDAQVYLDLPELGVIPVDEAAVAWRFLIACRRITLPGPSAEKRPGVCSWRLSRTSDVKRKPSLLAECTRTTLTSIPLA